MRKIFGPQRLAALALAVLLLTLLALLATSSPDDVAVVATMQQSPESKSTGPLQPITAANAVKVSEVGLLAGPGSALSVAFLPHTGTLTLAVGREDSRVTFWQQIGAAGVEPTATASLKTNSNVLYMDVSADGQLLAARGGVDRADYAIDVWQLSDHSLQQSLRGHTDHSLTATFSPSGRLLASGGLDGTVRVWNAQDGVLLHTFELSADRVAAVAFSPDEELLVAGGDSSTLSMWRVADYSLVRDIVVSGWVNTVSFSPDGALLATDNQIWRVADGSAMAELQGGGAAALAFSPDGTVLATAWNDDTMRLWRVADGSLLASLAGHSDNIESLDFSGDGKLIATGSWDHSARLWGVR